MPVVQKPISWIASLGVFTSINLLGSAHAASDYSAVSSSASIASNSAEIPVQVRLASLTPNCPLPRIPLTEQTAQEITGLFIVQEPVEAEEMQPPTTMTSLGDNPVLLTSQLDPRIGQLVETGKLEEALALTRQIQEPTARAEHLALISRAYLERGQTEQAEAVAFSIPVSSSEAAQFSSGLPSARDRALLGIVTHYINAGELESALVRLIGVTEPYQVYKLLDIAEQYRQQGNSVAVSAVLDLAEAVALSPSVVSLNPDERDDGSPPIQVWALWKMAKYYISRGQLESALTVVERLDETYQGSLLLDIAQKYREQGRFDLALPILDRALENYRATMETPLLPNSQPDPTSLIESILNNAFHFFTLDQFASEYMALREPEKAAELASEMFSLAQTFINLGEGTSALSALLRTVNIYRTVNQNEQANTVLEFVTHKTRLLEKTYLKAIVLSDISKLYADLGDRARAQEMLSQAQQITDTTTDISQRNLSTIALIQAYAALSQFENALRSAETIEPLELRQQIQQAIDCTQNSSTDDRSRQRN